MTLEKMIKMQRTLSVMLGYAKGKQDLFEEFVDIADCLNELEKEIFDKIDQK